MAWRAPTPGRTVDPRGYVLIKQPSHHLADVRGYVYEHRLVAEQMLGRPLRPGEEVHHGPGGTSDNRPENLTICGSRWEHQQHHSSRPGRTRAPGEANPLIACLCGCGALFTRYDGYGRPRRYVPGHNPSIATTQAAILAALADGPRPLAYLTRRCGKAASVKCALTRMTRAGTVRRIGRGTYAAAVASKRLPIREFPAVAL